MIKQFIKKRQWLMNALLRMYHFVKYGTLRHMYKWPERKLIKCQLNRYKRKHGRKCNFDNPVLFSEKIQRYIFCCNHPDVNRITDKVSFKDYVNEKLGSGYVIPMYGAWDNIQSLEADWYSGKLPEEFVLKSNLQCGGQSIKYIHHKSEVDFVKLKKELGKWLKIENTLMNSTKRHLYWSKPMILAERYMANFESQLYDYKFFCFDGEAFCVLSIRNRFQDGDFSVTFYDMNWNKLDARYGTHPVCDVECPEHFAQMKQVAEKLSKGFPQVRVDFFDTKEGFYVSELTFASGDGIIPLYPVSFDKLLGDKFILPEQGTCDWN